MEKIGEQFSSKPIVTNALCKEIIFVQADIHDCDESARKFGIEALPSVFILEQDQKWKVFVIWSTKYYVNSRSLKESMSQSIFDFASSHQQGLA